MRLKTTLLFILACFLQSPFAQITVLGKLAIGDTSHFHILRTTRNDQFIGKVMSWSTDSLIFETTSKARIAFPVSVVKSIEASETQQASSIGTDIFILRTTDGGIYYGFPTSISEKKITFEANKAGILKLGPEEVISMEAETAFLVTKAPYINEYQLKDNDWNKTDGELIAYREGHIFHQDAKGMVWRVPVEGVKKYELKPQYQPFTGHGRSLMFVPTGFGMAPFETEYRNIALGINIFAFGITEHLSAGVGLVTILPYGDLKWSQDFGKYVHWSVGGYVFVPFSVGYHTSLSLGTPDYFLNLNYLRNFDIKPFDSFSDFESFSFGASIRAGRRSRIFAEYNMMVAPKDGDGFGYESFYYTGYGNSFSWGYGWYKRRLRFETGIMEVGPFETYCFPEGSCPALYHSPAPFFSFSVKF